MLVVELLYSQSANGLAHRMIDSKIRLILGKPTVLS